MQYFFNLAGAVHDPDDEGHELPDIETARLEAVLAVADFLRDQPEVVWKGEELRMEVTNADQLVLFTLIVLGVASAANV
jgi:hypothetical protein